MFGNPETTTGGNALKFYASQRLDIRRTSTALKDKEGNQTGNHVKVKVAKNKLAPPFRTCEFDIMYGEGISKTGEIVDLGAEMNILEKSGAWYGYNGTKIAQGRDAAKQFLMDNPEVADEIEAKIKGELLGIFNEDDKTAPTDKKKPKKAKVLSTSEDDMDNE
jgi:recombination protein RecA